MSRFGNVIALGLLAALGVGIAYTYRYLGRAGPHHQAAITVISALIVYMDERHTIPQSWGDIEGVRPAYGASLHWPNESDSLQRIVQIDFASAAAGAESRQWLKVSRPHFKLEPEFSILDEKISRILKNVSGRPQGVGAKSKSGDSSSGTSKSP